MADVQDPVEQFLELAVYAPLGMMLEARRRIPEFSRIGRIEVEQRVQLARFVGEFAVRRAVKELGGRVAAFRSTTATAPPAAAPAAAEPEPARPSVSAAAIRRSTAASAPAMSDLAIAGYDSLAASQIVRLLDGLSGPELDAVAQYETAHRGRRTVLGKIEQVRADR